MKKIGFILGFLFISFVGFGQSDREILILKAVNEFRKEVYGKHPFKLRTEYSDYAKKTMELYYSNSPDFDRRGTYHIMEIAIPKHEFTISNKTKKKIKALLHEYYTPNLSETSLLNSPTVETVSVLLREGVHNNITYVFFLLVVLDDKPPIIVY